MRTVHVYTHIHVYTHLFRSVPVFVYTCKHYIYDVHVHSSCCSQPGQAVNCNNVYNIMLEAKDM